MSKLVRRSNPCRNATLHTDRPLTLHRMATDVNHGCVYFIRVGQDIKIGYTTRLSARLRRYGPGAYERLMFVTPGTLADEQALHRRFAPFRSHGAEYYAPVPHLIRYINEQRESVYGLPPLDSVA